MFWILTWWPEVRICSAYLELPPLPQISPQYWSNLSSLDGFAETQFNLLFLIPNKKKTSGRPSDPDKFSVPGVERRIADQSNADQAYIHPSFHQLQIAIEVPFYAQKCNYCTHDLTSRRVLQQRHYSLNETWNELAEQCSLSQLKQQTVE